MSKITLDLEGVVATVETDAVALDTVLEELIKPALLAVGFASASVDKVRLGGDDD